MVDNKVTADTVSDFFLVLKILLVNDIQRDILA